MILKYENTIDDFVAFNRYHSMHSPSLKMHKYWIFFFGAVTVAFAVAVASADLPFATRLAVVSVAVAVFGVLIFILPILPNWLFLWLADRNVRRMVMEGANKGVLCEHELTIDTVGLIEKTAVNENRQSWKIVERIAETTDHIFLYTSATSGHVIPKRRSSPVTRIGFSNRQSNFGYRPIRIKANRGDSQHQVDSTRRSKSGERAQG